MSTWEPCIGASDEWYTPAYIFDGLGVGFDVDVAHPDARTHVPCAAYLTKSDDGLSAPWRGFVWMNPPFGGRNGIAPWLEKFIEHSDGIALTPDRTSAPWFQRAARRVDRMLFLSPKVQFERPDGSRGKSPGTGTVLMAIGEKGARALSSARALGLVLERAAG